MKAKSNSAANSPIIKHTNNVENNIQQDGELTLKVTILPSTQSSNSISHSTDSHTNTNTNTDSSTHATIELLDHLESEGNINQNEITNNYKNENNPKINIELTALKTRSIELTVASTGVMSPLSTLSAISGIPSIASHTENKHKHTHSYGAIQESPLPDENSVQIVNKNNILHMPQKSSQRSMDLSNLHNRPITSPAPLWYKQHVSNSNDFPARNRALSDSQEWDKQMNALKDMIVVQAQSRPGSANFAAMASSAKHDNNNNNNNNNTNKASFFGDDKQLPSSIYANMPMSAPVMDHNMFFNNMLNVFNTNNNNNPNTATSLMTQHNINKISHNQTSLLGLNSNINIGSTNIRNMNSDDNVSNLSSALSYLSGVPTHTSLQLQPSMIKTQISNDNDLSVIWNDENKSNSNFNSPTDDSHTHTMSGTLPTQLHSNIPSVVTNGNKTERSRDSCSSSGSGSGNSNSDDDDYSTTVTMSMGSHSHNILDPNKSNKISKHFRIPSVITDKAYSDDEESLNLPTLIQIDEGVQHKPIENQIDMLPEQNEDNESEMTIELQLDDDDEATHTLREETEEYSDTMSMNDNNSNSEEHTLLTKESQQYSDGSASEYQEYGHNNNNNNNNNNARNGSISGITNTQSSNTESISDSESDSESESESETNSKYKQSSIVINDDDFDNMLSFNKLTGNDIEKSFNDDSYYQSENDNYDDDEYED